MQNIFTPELKDAIAGLDHDFRQQIFSFLLSNEKVSYSVLKKNIQTKKGNLNHHLIMLQKGGLIGKYVKKDTSGKKNSYYKITDLGKKIIDGLVNSLELKQKNITVQSFFDYKTPEVLENITLNNVFDYKIPEVLDSIETINQNIARLADTWIVRNEEIQGEEVRFRRAAVKVRNSQGHQKMDGLTNE